MTTGNPQPVVAFKNREGANLFTASLVALNADTGKMAWYFQVSRTTRTTGIRRRPPCSSTAPINGQPRKLVGIAARNGHFFVLDRTNGKAIVSTEYIKTNWSLGYDERGQPIPNPAKRPQIAGALVTPNQGGATNWYRAELQSADRPVLRERESRVQRVVHLRRRATTRWAGAAPIAAATRSSRS